MRRDWKAEGMSHDFHPTTDLLANRKPKKGLE
jgi:hypothetical protein